MKNNNREFVLVEKKVEALDVTSLFLKPVDGLEYNFIAGQYVNIKPPTSSGYGKSYTISSSPDEGLICITIKRKGETSSALIDMEVGEKISLEGPFGYFFPKDYDKEIVMIAGGIGVTPFYSVIKDIVSKDTKTKITLFYSNKNIKGITFFDELNEITKNNLNINIVYSLTQDLPAQAGKIKNNLIKEYSRIDKNILKKHLNNFKNKDYFICGSIEFVNTMWKLVKDKGVLELNIFTESFF